jgi:hypothetical protein
MKLLSTLGMLAMFLVGGGILVHGVPMLHHVIVDALHAFDGAILLMTSMLSNALVGLVAGVIVLTAVQLSRRWVVD